MSTLAKLTVYIHNSIRSFRYSTGSLPRSTPTCLLSSHKVSTVHSNEQQMSSGQCVLTPIAPLYVWITSLFTSKVRRLRHHDSNTSTGEGNKAHAPPCETLWSFLISFPEFSALWLSDLIPYFIDFFDTSATQRQMKGPLSENRYLPRGFSKPT